MRLSRILLILVLSGTAANNTRPAYGAELLNSVDKLIENLSLWESFDETLRYVKETMRYGASTKLEDMKNSEGWVYHLTNRRGGVFYTKNENNGWDPNVVKLNMVHYDKGMPQQEYQKINKSHRKIVESSIVSMILNAGNCGYQADLVTYYMWKNHLNGINRVEVVAGKDGKFDHVFNIINRKQGSSLNDSTTWGDAWVFDAWLGVYYKASEYKTRMKEALIKTAKDRDELQKYEDWDVLEGNSIQDLDKEDFLHLKSLSDIKPNLDTFPVELDKAISVYDFPVGIFLTESHYKKYQRMHIEKLNPILNQIANAKQNPAFRYNWKKRLKLSDDLETEYQSVASDAVKLVTKELLRIIESLNFGDDEEAKEYVNKKIVKKIKKLAKKVDKKTEGQKISLAHMMHDKETLQMVQVKLQGAVNRYLNRKNIDDYNNTYSSDKEVLVNSMVLFASKCFRAKNEAFPYFL